jgi:hypothetical protein
MALSLLPTLSLPVAKEGQQGIKIGEEDVEKGLYRPLLERSQTLEKAQSIKSGCTLPPHCRVSSKKRTVIDSDYRILNNMKPPYQVQNNYTILFKAVVHLPSTSR